MKNIYLDLCEGLSLVDKISECLYVQDYYNAMNGNIKIIGLLKEIIEYLKDDELLKNDVTNVIFKMHICQNNDDYIGLADIYSYELKRVMYCVRDKIKGTFVYDMCDYYEYNYNNASSGIKKILETYNINDADNIPDEYTLIENDIGGYSIKKHIYNNREILYNSINNPKREAELIANKYIKDSTCKVCIVGYAMGYIANYLIKIQSIDNIYIYEPDINILKIGFHYTDMKELLVDKRVHIEYDPVLEKFARDVDSSWTVIVHRPTMKSIDNKDIRESLEDFFIKQSSVFSQKKLLDNNFYYNLKHNNNYHYVDELYTQFLNKKVVLVAAGPSTEKAISKGEIIKYRENGYIIVCVGTILKLLDMYNNKPDYVFMIDAQSSMINQIKGVNTEKYNLIYFPTLSMNVVSEWKGDRYMALQMGYEPSEKLSLSKGLMLFDTGGSVSTFAIDLPLRFHCSEIVCIGLDLAYVDDKRHAGESTKVNNMDDRLREVACVRGGRIKTSKNLDNYRKWIEKRLYDREEKDVILINKSEGAYIKGML